MDRATTSVSSPRNSETRDETGMEQVLSDLQALKSLYGLLHKGPEDENLDETSRALLMKMLDDATQQTLLKQAKMLSGSLMSPVLERKLTTRSDRRTRDAEPPLSLNPPASPRPSLLGGKRPSRLNQQYSTVSSRRAGGHIDSRRQAAEEPLLARLASHRSSRTTASALPPRHRPSGKQPNSGLSLYHLPVAATSQHRMVTGSNQRAGRRDRARRTSGRGDQLSTEGSSRRRSLSRDVSLGQARLLGRGTGLHVGAESSSSTRRFGRLGSGLSLSMMSRRGSERVGRGVPATSQHGTVTGSNRRLDRTGHRSSRGDQSSLEGSSRGRSVSREVSLGRSQLHGRGMGQPVGAESSSPMHRFGRLNSGLSLSITSRRGSEQAGRGVAATSQRGTVTGSNQRAGRRDRMRHSSSHGDQSSSQSSSSRRSMSREVSLGRPRLHGRGMGQHVGAESTSPTHHFGRLNSGLSLSMASRRGSEPVRRGMATSSQHGTVTGSNQRAGRRDRTHHRTSRGDQSSSESSNSRRSLSREASLGRPWLQGRGTDRRVGAESSSSTRRGSERAGRGVASPEQSSSSKTMVTIRSRITPNRDLKDKERCLRRAGNKEKEESTPRRGRKLASVSSGGWSSSRPPRRTRKHVNSGSMYISSRHSSSDAAISYPSTSPTVSPEPSASASFSPPPVSRRGIAMPAYTSASCSPPPVQGRGIAWPAYASASYSPPPVQGRGIAWPVYAPKMSRSMRRRRRVEVLQSRVERLRMLKNKIATVFHHHHHYERGQEGPSSRRIPRDDHHKSPWQYLGGMFHHMKGQVQVVAAKEKRRGGGRNMHAFFDAMRRQLQGKRRAPASVKMRKMANRSRVRTKKMHWWQRLKPRRGKAEMMAGSRP